MLVSFLVFGFVHYDCVGVCYVWGAFCFPDVACLVGASGVFLILDPIAKPAKAIRNSQAEKKAAPRKSGIITVPVILENTS